MHRMEQLTLQAPALRGIYEAPFFDQNGAILLIAVTRAHRILTLHRVFDAAEYDGLYARLQRELDEHDPIRLRLER
jgi:hypothetical protein